MKILENIYYWGCNSPELRQSYDATAEKQAAVNEIYLKALSGDNPHKLKLADLIELSSLNRQLEIERLTILEAMAERFCSGIIEGITESCQRADENEAEQLSE